jgi:hypothetical protein
MSANLDERRDWARVGGDVVGRERRDDVVEHQRVPALPVLGECGLKHILKAPPTHANTL